MELKDTVSLMRPMSQGIVITLQNISSEYHIKATFLYAFVSSIKYKIKSGEVFFHSLQKVYDTQNIQAF